MQDSTDKWDGLLEEGTPRTGPQPHTEQRPPRPRREYNWSRIFLTVATIILVVTVTATMLLTDIAYALVDPRLRERSAM